jgi:prepilin-type N-terminal cleavage/methylation domain-containing protein
MPDDRFRQGRPARALGRGRRNAGFSLAETLVALAIGAGVVTAYYKAVSQSLDLELLSRARGEAALIVAGLIDQIGHEMPLDPGRSEGRTGAYTWSVTILDGASLAADAGQAAPSTVRMRQIDIEVQGGALRASHRVSTLRVTGDVLR